MSDSGSIELTPSFPEKLEREASCLFRKQVPMRPRVLIFVGLVLLLLLALAIFDAVFVEEFSASHIAALAVGGIAFAGYIGANMQLDVVHAIRIQTEARQRGLPINFRFTPKRFVLDMANARTEYQWNAIDEIAALKTGTAIRVGVFAYPVADADLPDDLSPREFRARLDGWRAEA